jgi:hypothetical protein
LDAVSVGSAIEIFPNNAIDTEAISQDECPVHFFDFVGVGSLGRFVLPDQLHREGARSRTPSGRGEIGVDGPEDGKCIDAWVFVDAVILCSQCHEFECGW